MRSLLLAILVAAPTAAQSDGPAPPSSEEFAKLHDELCPKVKGKWERIPWSVDLLTARRRAMAEKKPLFLWSMNGHPLGCT